MLLRRRAEHQINGWEVEKWEEAENVDETRRKAGWSGASVRCC